MTGPRVDQVPQPRRSNVQSVDRALAILEVIAEHGGAATLSELAAATKLPAATAHRLLRTMITSGFVSQSPDRSYLLGAKLVPLGEAASAGNGRRTL